MRWINYFLTKLASFAQSKKQRKFSKKQKSRDTFLTKKTLSQQATIEALWFQISGQKGKLIFFVKRLAKWDFQLQKFFNFQSPRRVVHCATAILMLSFSSHEQRHIAAR